MLRNHAILNVVLACLIFILGGCASKSGLITSLEDLTTESIKEGSFKIPQYRVLSIPGLLPFPEPGSLQFFKPQRRPASAIGLSNSSDSYVIQSIIESECDEDCLSKIRDNLLLVRGKAEALVEARIKLTKLASTPPSEGSAASIIDTYKNNLTEADSNYSKIRQELDSEHQKTLGSINKNGILIYRWNSNSNKNGSLGLGDIFGASGNKNETYSGFALVSGLRTASLYVGRDIVEFWKNRLDIQSYYSNRFELTTYVMQAKHIIYIAEYDLQSMVSAKLKASYAQLSNLSETIKGLDRIEIDAALSKVSNLSNMGIVGNIKRTTRIVDWKKPLGILDLKDLDGWQTFYSVESDLTDLIKMLKSENTQ